VSAPAAVEIADQASPFDFEEFFRAHYGRIARVAARVVRDHGRAEEIAVEAFWKFWRAANAPKDHRAPGWVYRTAVRMALDDLRKHARRLRYESETEPSGNATPEEVHAAAQECVRVRLVLASLDLRQAELLLLRADGLSYSEAAEALDLNPASVGTLLSRAQQAFRKEYVRQYGELRSNKNG
jgi:RNA polymerase sigma-70 factor (ECF subfamily)